MKTTPARALNLSWMPLFLLAWFVGLIPAGSAQDEEPRRVGNYDFAGTTSFGYRFLDLNGNQAKYNQLLNLQEGFRVFDTQLSFQSVETNQGWFDRFSLATQNLGGDPFPVIRVQLRKHGLYELRASYRATQYFVNLPQTELSTNREWIDRRRFGDLDLRYTPTRHLRFRFYYNRTERDGNEFSTGPFFYIPLAADVWSAFGRANVLPWTIPLEEKANLFGGGIDYRLGNTDIHLEQSYRTYNNPANLGGFGGQPIELLGPTSPALNLQVPQWNSFASFNIPMTQLRVDQRVTSHLQLRGGYIYTHASGPTGLDGVLLNRAVLTGSPAQPLAVNFLSAGTTDMTSHTGEVGFTLTLLERLDLVSDYRYQTFTESGKQSFQAIRSDLPTAFDLGSDLLNWDFGIHTLDTVLAFVPLNTLSARAGLRFVKQDIVHQENGATALGTRRSWYYAPIFNISWRPSTKLKVMGQFEHQTTVDPYVRITPEGTVGSNIKVHYSPSDRWGIENAWSFRNRETEMLDFEMRSRNNSTTVWYQPIAKIGLNAGFIYSSFFSQNTVAFLRGTPPLTGLFSTEQFIDRTYFWGLRANPVRDLT
ncbi:MAG: hypothetical protein HY313_04670, partial [Acidobacteria bacterium]|nr:hypothetical protein [Acidobacteriota bacterium]